MHDPFSVENLLAVYTNLKARKHADRKKQLPIGVDGVSTAVFDRNVTQSIAEIHRKLRPDDSCLVAYSFAPLLRMERRKTNGGVRALHVPRLRDQIVLRIIHDELVRCAKQKGLALHLRPPHAFVDAFDTSIQSYTSPWILKADISVFYDSVPRERAIRLCKELGMHKVVFNLLEKWSSTLKIRYGNSIGPAQESVVAGLPQGLSISSSLAELYAGEIDKLYRNHSGYFRYVDDILMICSSYEEAKRELDQLKKTVESLGLRLSPTKTRIAELSSGVEWLGMVHFPESKQIHAEKLEQWSKPFKGIQKECIAKLLMCQSESDKRTVIQDFLKNIERYMRGKKGSRLRWYALIKDHGQWKSMDKFIHGIIRSCMRMANLDAAEFGPLPSIHAKIQAVRKQKESHQLPTKGNAPSVE